VLFAQDIDGIKFSKDGYNLLNWRIVEYHIKLFSIFHKDNIVIFKDSLIAFDILEIFLQFINSRIELLSKCLQIATQ